MYSSRVFCRQLAAIGALFFATAAVSPVGSQEPAPASAAPRTARVAPTDGAAAADPGLERLGERIADVLSRQGGRRSMPGRPGLRDLVIRVKAAPSESAREGASRRGAVHGQRAGTGNDAEADAAGAHAPATDGRAGAGHVREPGGAAAGHGPPRAHAHAHAHWSYQGETGPEHWASLSPQYTACGDGTRQSPIDIRDGLKVELASLAFDYQPGAFSVLDNGHTIQVVPAPGNVMQTLGRRWTLLQLHFHHPAEERVDGRGFEMVAHLVHRDDDGQLAVVAVLIEAGDAHPGLQAVFNDLPLERGQTQPGSGTHDPSSWLPQQRGYFAFMGSLTTPPCTEGVLWLVLKQPLQVSRAQLTLFARLYPMNARPLQAAGDRRIKESN